MEPEYCCDSRLLHIRIATPTRPRIGPKKLGLNIVASTPAPPTLVRLSSQEVAVVPTFAPMITPMACWSVMMPELTKPTTSTVVAPEDCMTAVTIMPSKKPLIGFAVSFRRIFCILPPASFSSPLPMVSMPKSSSVTPAIIDRMFVIVIVDFPHILQFSFFFSSNDSIL